MYSTRKLTGVLFSVAIGVMLVGCNSVPMQKVADRWDTTRRNFNAKVRPSQNRIESVMVDPPADEAAQLRGWDGSTFLYPNGATLAYPTYALTQEDRPNWLKNDYVYSLVAPGITLYNVFSMPVYMVMEPPTTAVTYHGARLPPSMTLAPPLQSEQQAQKEQQIIQQMREQRQPADAQPQPSSPAPAPQPESQQQPVPPPQPNTPVAPEPPSDKPSPADLSPAREVSPNPSR